MLACAAHPTAAAGWRCSTHGLLCPACAGLRQAGYARVEVCAACGEPVERLRAPRRLLRPFSSLLPGALAFPLQGGGLLSLLVVAVVLRLLAVLGARVELEAAASVLAGGLLLAWLLLVVRHTAAGHDDLPGPADLHGPVDDVLLPLLRALAAGAWLLLPLGLWLLLDLGPRAGGLADLDFFTPDGRPEPLPLLLLLAGALLLPLALLGAALRTPLLKAANPLEQALQAFALGGDYWLLSLFCLLCAAGAGSLWAGATQAGARAPIPLAGFWPVLLALYPPAAAARALGLLVRVRGDTLGQGAPEEYLEPVLDAEPEVRLGAPASGGWASLPAPAAPGTDPAVVEARPLPDGSPIWPLITPPGGTPALPPGRATPPPAAGEGAAASAAAAPGGAAAPGEEAGPSSAPAPVERGPRTPPPAAVRPPLPQAPPQQAAPHPQPRARQAPLAALLTPPAPPVDQHAAGLLARRITERDLDGAVRVFAEAGRSVPAHTLSAPAWVDLAKACLARAQGAPERAAASAGLSVLAFRRAAEVAPNGPLAPQAFLQAARLYDEQLRDRARSDQLLGELARRYPETAEGQFAARRLRGR